MSNITILTKTDPVTTIPRCATDTNFPAGSDPWSALATKVAPSSGMQTQGRVPDEPSSAEEENYYTAHFADSHLELQVQACSLHATGLNNANGVCFGWADKAHLLVSLENPSGTQQRRFVSIDHARSKVANMTNAFTGGGSYGPNMSAAIPNVIGGGSTVYFLYQGLAGGANLNAVNSTTPSDTLVAIPGAGTTQFTDIDTAAMGFNAVLLLGSRGTTFELSRIPVAGSPGAVTIASWSTDSDGVLAQKPGENRAWQTSGTTRKTFGTTDGGVTLGATVTTTWDGGSLGANVVMMRPTWDEVKERWIVGTADISGGSTSACYANMVSSSKLWTSTDGVAWTTLHDSPNVMFACIRYHRGLLWAIGLQLNEHQGMEIWCSRDGGDSWMRTGHVLSLYKAFTGMFPGLFLRDTRIKALSGQLLFQTTISLQGSAFSPGGLTGCEYVVLRTSDCYSNV
jgi:hypothetical protein